MPEINISKHLTELQQVIDDQPKAEHTPTEEEAPEKDAVLQSLINEFGPEKVMLERDFTPEEAKKFSDEMCMKYGHAPSEDELAEMTKEYEDATAKQFRVLMEALIKNQYNETDPKYAHLLRPMTALLVKIGEELYPTLYDLVGVQPMTAETGQLYRLEMKMIDIPEPTPEQPTLEGTPAKRMTLEIVKHVVDARAMELGADFVCEADLKDKQYMDTIAYSIADEIIVNVLKKLTQLGGEGDRFHDEVVRPVCGNAFACNINQMCNRIAQNTRRGAGNFVIMSRQAFNVLTSATNNYFKKGEQYGDLLCYMGTLTGTIKVFVNEDTLDNTVIVGYKGSSDTDTGYIYSPFIQAELIERFVPGGKNGEKCLAFWTRNAKGSFETVNGMSNSASYYELAEFDFSNVEMPQK